MWTCIGPQWMNRVFCMLFVVVVLFTALNSTEQQECGSGLYGLNCTKNCSHRMCFNNTAECNITGHCGFEGCIDGWFSADCTLKCEENCTKCEPQTGTCTGCTNGTDNILDRCTSLCERHNCTFATSKSCLSYIGCGSTCIIGYVGISCINVCSSNVSDCKVCTDSNCSACNWRVDQTCIQNCSTECLSVMCDQLIGPCIMGCQPGLFGDLCNKQCNHNCRSGVCDGQTGQCRDGCLRGFTGHYCDIICSSGCYNDECNQITGVCGYGCKDGYYGVKCDIPCSANCFENRCDRNTSACVQGCNSGWSGLTCSEATRTPVMALVIAVVVLSFIIIALLLVIWYLIRYIRKMQVKRRKSHFKVTSVPGDDVIEVLQRRKSEGDALEKDIKNFQKKYNTNIKVKDDVFTFDTESTPNKQPKPNNAPPQNSTEPNPQERELETQTQRVADVTENGGQFNTGYKSDEKESHEFVSDEEMPKNAVDDLNDMPDEVITESTKL